MNLTTKVEYAIRALAELAKVTDNKPVTIKQLCNRQNLPVKYMEQLFRKLKQNDLIKSIKGASGGYVLNRCPHKLSVKAIMSALEDEPIRLDCSGDKGQREYCIGQPCSFYETWKIINDDLDEYFDNIYLSRFIANQDANMQEQC